MFNNNVNSSGSGSNGGTIVQSGYKVGGELRGIGKLREEFADALTLDNDDVTVDTINKFAEKEGMYRGYNALLKRVSKQKLNAARAIGQSYNIAWQHAQGAAQQEIQWRQTTARNLEQMSEKLIDLGVVEKSHGGFATYLDEADKLVGY